MEEERDDQKTLSQSVRDRLDGSSVAEHILNVFKAGLGAVPFGGGLASLLSDYIPSSRFRRLEDFAAKVAEDLKRLEDRVRVEYLHTDEFAFIFEKCFRGTAENYQKERLEAFRGILVNSALSTDLATEEQEFFLNLVNNLSVVHIRVLSFMAKPKEYLAAADIPEGQIRGGFSTFMPIALPRIPVDVIRLSFEDLYRYGLTTTDSSIFGTMTSASGLRLLGDRVSKLGHRFIDFCTVP